MDRRTDAEIPVRFLAAAVAVAALVLASSDTNHSPSNVKGTPAGSRPGRTSPGPRARSCCMRGARHGGRVSVPLLTPLTARYGRNLVTGQIRIDHEAFPDHRHRNSG